MDHGTLHQLQNLIHRRNVKEEPKEDFNACEDFFILVVTCHILCVTMKYLKLDSLNSYPSSCDLIPDDYLIRSTAERQCILHAVASAIIDQTVDLSMTFSDDCETSTDGENDHILEYANEIISLGLLFMNYRDSIKEGDGNRVILCWKYMLPIFKATNRKNYAIEAFYTLVNCKLLPP